MLYDAFGEEELGPAVVGMIAPGGVSAGQGSAGGPAHAGLSPHEEEPASPLKIAFSKAEQSNSTLFYGEHSC